VTDSTRLAHSTPRNRRSVSWHPTPGCDRYLDQIRHTIGELRDLPGDTLLGHAGDQLLAAFRDWPAA